jgi:hypothetical protein
MAWEHRIDKGINPEKVCNKKGPANSLPGLALLQSQSP